MHKVECIPVREELPASFFALAGRPYEALPFRPDDEPDVIREVFRMEAQRNEILLYTDHASLRLVGIFPHGAAEAYFGFWETEEALASNREAFALLEADARSRGRAVVIGPLHFNTFHRYRLRLGEPSWGMFDREPVNPSYYPSLLGQLGYSVRSTFESRLIRKETVPDVYVDKQGLLAALDAIPFQFIPLDEAAWVRHEDEIVELVHQVFSANPAYKPISREQFELLYNRQFAARLCPHSSVLFRDKASGQLAAMSFCHPNYHALPAPPAGAPVFARDFPALPRKVLLAKSVGVHPGFRRQGLMAYLGAYAMLSFRELYDEVVFCLMRSDNFSLHFSNDYPYEAAQYALYHKVPDGK
jgi:GNAT superfamily N-acetyltransferase